MSAGRGSIVSIVASDDMFPISWIIPGLRALSDRLSHRGATGSGMGEPPLRTGALNMAAAEALSGNCHICEVQHCEAESSDWLELTGTKDSKEAWREVIRNKVKHSKIGNIVLKRETDSVALRIFAVCPFLSIFNSNAHLSPSNENKLNYLAPWWNIEYENENHPI